MALGKMYPLLCKSSSREKNVMQFFIFKIAIYLSLNS